MQCGRKPIYRQSAERKYRLRVGDWRVIYTLLDDVLVVLGDKRPIPEHCYRAK
jgi:hypothetical protein